MQRSVLRAVGRGATSGYVQNYVIPISDDVLNPLGVALLWTVTGGGHKWPRWFSYSYVYVDDLIRNLSFVLLFSPFHRAAACLHCPVTVLACMLLSQLLCVYVWYCGTRTPS